MALSVVHSTVVVVADDGTSPVGTDEWNDDHDLSGTLPIANGGTAATTAADAATNLGLGTGDTPTFTGVNISSTDTTLTRSAAGVVAVEGTVIALTGKQSIPVPAAAMTASTTNGAAAGAAEATTNKNMFVTFDFDATTSESVQFSMFMPKSWNESTITGQAVWSHAATTTNFGVVFELSAVAASNDDTGDVAFGTGQTMTDTGGTTDDIYISPESSAITIGGSPAEGDFVMFKVARLPANGSDTLAVDARLHGIKINVTTDAGNDA